MLCTKVKYCMSNNQTIVGYFLQSCEYSRTPDERPPSPTTIPLIRPHFV